MNIYEMHGRQAEKMQEVSEAWQRTLALLRDIHAGKVLPAQLTVGAEGWDIHPIPLKEQESNEAAGG